MTENSLPASDICFRYTVTPVVTAFGTEWQLKTRMGKIMIPTQAEAELLASRLNQPNESLKRRSREIDVDSWTFEHRCPRCAFPFNDK